MRIILSMFLPLMFVMTIGLSEKAVGADNPPWFVVQTSYDPYQFEVVCSGTRGQALDTAAILRAINGDNGIHALPEKAVESQQAAGIIAPDGKVLSCSELYY